MSWKRRLVAVVFTFCAAMSLLLCHTVCVVWARSYAVSDNLSHRGPDGEFSIHSATGQVVLYAYWRERQERSSKNQGMAYSREEPKSYYNPFMTFNYNPGNERFDWEGGDFILFWVRTNPLKRIWLSAVAPFWSVALATALLPAAWTGLWWRSCRRRRSARQ
ncbi:MAG: hypothetical protein WBC44_19740 [Planctomycetaceae bacterium]